MDDTQKKIQTANPMHILLLADDSNSMRGAAAEAVTAGIQNWLISLQSATRGKKAWFRFSLIVFGTNANVIVAAADLNKVDATEVVIDGTSGYTNIAEALDKARETIAEDARATPNDCPPFVFLYTDGRAYTGEDATQDAHAARRSAAALKEMSLPQGAPRVICLGFGECDESLLAALATSPAFFKRVPSAEELKALLPAMGTPTTRGQTSGTVAEFERQIVDI